jgi:2Fe-2S ferredoxin
MAARVRVEPAGLEFDVPEGVTIMEAATHAGLRWPSLCQGQCECTTCHFLVVEGSGNLVGAAKTEIEVLALLMRRYPSAEPGSVRLACQSILRGDLIVHKLGVTPVQRP